jgi:glycosyltransferase A (GT-A) superfamily protein (DUF2064 family)
VADAFSGLVVVLENDVRGTDAELLITAINQLRGVQTVLPVTSRPGLEIVLRQRIAAALRERLLAALAGEGAE